MGKIGIDLPVGIDLLYADIPAKAAVIARQRLPDSRLELIMHGIATLAGAEIVDGELRRLLIHGKIEEMVPAADLLHRLLVPHGKRHGVIVANPLGNVEYPDMQIRIGSRSLKIGINGIGFHKPAQELLFTYPVHIKMLDHRLLAIYDE